MAIIGLTLHNLIDKEFKIVFTTASKISQGFYRNTLIMDLNLTNLLQALLLNISLKVQHLLMNKTQLTPRQRRGFTYLKSTQIINYFKLPNLLLEEIKIERDLVQCYSQKI